MTVCVDVCLSGYVFFYVYVNVCIFQLSHIAFLYLAVSVYTTHTSNVK